MAQWIQKAIKHPGIETQKAKRNGVSLGSQLSKDAKSSNPHVRARGLLGQRFRSGDLHKA